MVTIKNQNPPHGFSGRLGRSPQPTLSEVSDRYFQGVSMVALGLPQVF
jgi:hypothetical protein